MKFIGIKNGCQTLPLGEFEDHESASKENPSAIAVLADYELDALIAEIRVLKEDYPEISFSKVWLAFAVCEDELLSVVGQASSKLDAENTATLQYGLEQAESPPLVLTIDQAIHLISAAQKSFKLLASAQVQS